MAWPARTRSLLSRHPFIAQAFVHELRVTLRLRRISKFRCDTPGSFRASPACHQRPSKVEPGRVFENGGRNRVRTCDPPLVRRNRTAWGVACCRVKGQLAGLIVWVRRLLWLSI